MNTCRIVNDCGAKNLVPRSPGMKNDDPAQGGEVRREVKRIETPRAAWFDFACVIAYCRRSPGPTATIAHSPRVPEPRIT